MLSLLIILISLTGTLLVWKKEYLLLSVPQARGAQDMTPAAAALVVQRAESRFGGENILLIQFQSENTALHKVFLSGSRYAYLDKEGGLVDTWQMNGRFEEWVYDLHHRLLMGNTGLLISGFSALILLGLIIPGLFAWWPTKKSFQWRVFVKGFFSKAVLRPQLLATHRNLGVVSVVPISLLLITAVFLSFPDQVQSLLVAPHQEKDSYSDLFVAQVDELAGADQGQLEPSFARAQTLLDGAKIRSIQLPYGFAGYNLIGLQKQGEWHPGGLSRVYIDPNTGVMDMSLDSAKLPASEKLYNLSYPLHTGKVDSLLYRLFLTSIGCGMLLLSGLGLLTFIQKLRVRLRRG